MTAYAHMTDEELASAEELCCEVANQSQCVHVKAMLCARIRAMREECKSRTRILHDERMKGAKTW